MFEQLKETKHWTVIGGCLLMGLLTAACEYVFYWVRKLMDKLTEETED